MTAAEIAAKRRENRKLMETATGEMQRLCQEMEEVLAAMAYKTRRRPKSNRINTTAALSVG